jgi:hypothetical protein
MSDSQRAAVMAVSYALVLVAMSVDSAPRRVGDGGEYLVMTARLARFQNPALTQSELGDAKASLRALGAGFDDALLDYPLLVGTDGRQSFLHFWMYPLAATPAMWLADAFHLHPNWAFTITNIWLLATAAHVLARFAPAACVVYVLASPIVWWVDKAHAEVFLYAALSIAVALIGRRPMWAMVAFAVAAAQNAALAVTYPLFAATTLVLSRRSGRLRVRDIAGALVGALIVALPFVYNWLRLGRVSPMAEYAHVTAPSLFAMLGFVLEPNIGLAPAMPGYLVVSAAVAISVVAVRTAPPTVWWPALIQAMLLWVWTQNPNANHGGTPGVNRWTLSLVPLTLPWAGAAYTASRRTARRVLIALLILTANYTVYFHLPSRPEGYLQPTRLAQTLWANGWLRMTPAEVFAERTSASETPVVPLSDDRCHVILVWDMQVPLECVPPGGEMPPTCSGVESFCLATIRDTGVHVVPVAFNGFFFRPSPQSWPASGPLASGIRAAMLSLDATARRWQAVSERQVVHEKNAIEGVVVLRTERGLLIYVARTGAAPFLKVGVAPVKAALHSLLPFRELANFAAPVDDALLTRALPPHASNLALLMLTQENR